MGRRLEIPVGTRPNGSLLVSTSSTYLQEIGHHQKRHSYVDVLCDCGIIKAVRASHFLSGYIRSCGCLNRIATAARCRGIVGAAHPCYKGANGIQPIKHAWFLAEKANPCMDCGQRYPHPVMQFDHRDSSLKCFMVNINTVMSKRSLTELKAERQKCDLVCANCHWWRTWLRSTGKPLTPLSEWDDSQILTEVA
jgi:hypothetical protein